MGGYLLLHDGYTYCRVAQSGEKTYWKCSSYTRYKCPARAHTNDRETIIVTRNHNHYPKVPKWDVDNVLIQIRAQSESTNDPIENIVQNALNGLGPETTANLPAMASLRHIAEQARLMQQIVGKLGKLD